VLRARARPRRVQRAVPPRRRLPGSVHGRRRRGHPAAAHRQAAGGDRGLPAGDRCGAGGRPARPGPRLPRRRARGEPEPAGGPAGAEPVGVLVRAVPRRAALLPAAARAVRGQGRGARHRLPGHPAGRSPGRRPSGRGDLPAARRPGRIGPSALPGGSRSARRGLRRRRRDDHPCRVRGDRLLRAAARPGRAASRRGSL
ncbi:MAG: hypothetical protein AVDCRST_MAG72-228, partial [uncultured Nocardioidaceae bacterium]